MCLLANQHLAGVDPARQNQLRWYVLVQIFSSHARYPAAAGRIPDSRQGIVAYDAYPDPLNHQRLLPQVNSYSGEVGIFR